MRKRREGEKRAENELVWDEFAMLLGVVWEYPLDSQIAGSVLEGTGWCCQLIKRGQDVSGVS